MTPRSFVSRLAGRSRSSADLWRQSSGPIATLGIVTLAELLSGTPAALSSPGPLLLMAVVYAAFAGGLFSGLLSAAISLLYALFYDPVPSRIQALGDMQFRRVAVLALTAPALVALVHVLKRRLESKARMAASAQAIGESEERYRLLFDRNPLPMWVVDAETLAFLAVNQAAVRKYGYALEEFLGMTIKDIRPPEDVPALLEQISRTSESFCKGTWRHRKKDGTLMDVEITGNKLRFAGRPAHLVLANDVTQRKGAEDRLKKSEAQLQEAQRVAGLGSWEWDISTDTVTWSDELYRMFGLRREEFAATYDGFQGRVFPEDRDRVRTTVEGALEDRKPYTHDFRIVRPDGAIRWVRSLGEVVTDGLGRPLRLVGTGQDITESRQAVEALRESEERFRLLVEGVKDYAIFMLDPDGNVVSWSESAERMKGYRAEEILGRHFGCFYPEEDVEGRRPQAVLGAAGLSGRSEDEGWRVRKDGSRFWANIVISALRDGEGLLRGYCTVTRDMTERKRAEDTLREVSGRLLRTQTEERRRIARELHDSTAQNLAALAMNIGMVQKAAAGLDETARKRLSDSLDLAQQCCREIRTLSYLLHPPALEEADLWSAVRRYAEGFTDRSGIRVDLRAPREVGRLPEEVETTLFRIVQESLGNIHRHSGSQRARIRLERHPDNVTLVVGDEGHGMEAVLRPEAGDHAALGVGIAGMRERVRQLGGQIEIASGRRGTRVKVKLPLELDH